MFQFQSWVPLFCLLRILFCLKWGDWSPHLTISHSTLKQMSGRNNYWVNVTRAALINHHWVQNTESRRQWDWIEQDKGIPCNLRGHTSRSLARVATVEHYESDSCFKMKTSQCGTAVNSQLRGHFLLVNFPINQLAALFSHNPSHMSVILLFFYWLHWLTGNLI